MGGMSSHTISPLPTDKVVIITGGNTGIGYETAKSAAIMGAKVILAVRTEERGKSAISKMEAAFMEAKQSGQTYGLVDRPKLDVQYRVCDLSSLKSVMQFIEWFKSTGLNIHALICNAATYSLQEVETEDKWEAMYQVNYLGHFLMVSHFLPIICKSGDDCRIVFITSEAHKEARYNVEYVSTSKMTKYDAFTGFANTKMFQIMHMYSLDRVLEKLPTVDVFCVDRGKLDALAFPNDERSEEGFSCKFCCMKCCGNFTENAKGADTALYAAFDPNLKGMSRGYLLKSRDKPRWPSRESRNKELQDYLWKCSIENLKDYMTGEVLKTLQEI